MRDNVLTANHWLIEHRGIGTLFRENGVHQHSASFNRGREPPHLRCDRVDVWHFPELFGQLYRNVTEDRAWSVFAKHDQALDAVEPIPQGGQHGQR